MSNEVGLCICLIHPVGRELGTLGKREVYAVQYQISLGFVYIDILAIFLMCLLWRN